MALLTPSIVTIDHAVYAMTFNAAADRELLLRLDAFPPGVAATVVRLFDAVKDFDELVSEFMPHARSFDGNQRADFIDDIDKKFAGIEQLMNEANAQLTAAFG